MKEKDEKRNLTFDEVLRRLRTRHAGLYQEPLAQSIGVTVKTFQNWENGVTKPGAANLRRLIAEYVHRNIFVAGIESEEARELWNKADLNVAFDSTWFQWVMSNKPNEASASSLEQPREELLQSSETATQQSDSAAEEQPERVLPPMGPASRHRRLPKYVVVGLLVIAVVLVSAVAASLLLFQPPKTPQEIYSSAVVRSPDFKDPLTSQDANDWDELDASDGGCMFVGEAYRVTINQKGLVQLCEAHAKNFSDFTFEVQMTIIQGDGGGLTFRDSGNSSNIYRFRVSADGSYDLFATFFTNPFAPPELKHIFASGQNLKAIRAGLRQTNTLGIVARGNTISLFVNRHYLASVSDPSPGPGLIGLFAVDFSNNTTVAFRNVKVWYL